MQNGVKYNDQSVSDILRKNKRILETWMNLGTEDELKGIHEAFLKENGDFLWWKQDKAEGLDKQFEQLGMIISWAAAENISAVDIGEIKSKIKVAETTTKIETGMAHGATAINYNQAISTENLKKLFGKKKEDGSYSYTSAQTEMFNYFVNSIAYVNSPYKGEATDNKLVVKTTQTSESKTTVRSDLYLLSSGSSLLGYNGNSVTEGENFYWTEVFDDLIELKSASDTNSGKYVSGSGKRPRLLSDLATYFRNNAYEVKIDKYNQTGIAHDTNKAKVQNMLMYTILVMQSLVLFIAYIKRLFYVVILGMMGPIVVVFDFFQKFGK